MYRLSYESSALSPQPNQGYSPLKRINLDMDMKNLFDTQDYYAALIEDDSPVEEVAPVKAKKVSEGRQKSVTTENKESNKSGSFDITVYQKACAEYAVEYDHDCTLEQCWAILRDHYAWKQVEMPLFYSKENKVSKKSKTSETTSGSTQSGSNLNEEANGSGEEVREVRPVGRHRAKKKTFAPSRSESSSIVG
ncbi:retrotransposon protein, putative, ty3-gypsy subclass [Tanacetum coccineum]